mmetsp:Transcript_17350/g.40449  ORF Transcript_17350/g.40449 Transcript_17350/m.40449 type:complete len:261 (+) Transcript_17350:3789-4571(+)
MLMMPREPASISLNSQATAFGSRQGCPSASPFMHLQKSALESSPEPVKSSQWKAPSREPHLEIKTWRRPEISCAASARFLGTLKLVKVLLGTGDRWPGESPVEPEIVRTMSPSGALCSAPVIVIAKNFLDRGVDGGGFSDGGLATIIGTSPPADLCDMLEKDRAKSETPKVEDDSFDMLRLSIGKSAVGADVVDVLELERPPALPLPAWRCLSAAARMARETKSQDLMGTEELSGEKEASDTEAPPCSPESEGVIVSGVS